MAQVAQFGIAFVTLARMCQANAPLGRLRFSIGKICGPNFHEQAMTDITIFHNPKCGTSRNTLAMIRQSGMEPTVVEYLKSPPSRSKLTELIQAMGGNVRYILRQKGTPYDELDLGNPKWTDEQLLDFIEQHPVLINRPIVVTPVGCRLCRPSEVVLEILPMPMAGAFTKEDGEVIQAVSCSQR